VDDAWIAASAVAYDCPLVTHNPGDFGGIEDLKILTEKV
jgi:predicted nucleic acid-binding protein